MRWPSVLPAVLLVAVGACGGSDDGPDVVTGRVMSSIDGRVCISPDRGATETCVDVPGARDVPIEVGVCASVENGDEVSVIPDAACATGDLGD